LNVDDARARLGRKAEQGGRIAVHAARGGVFDLMAGLYSKNAAHPRLFDGPQRRRPEIGPRFLQVDPRATADAPMPSNQQ
jgi:hypothetical protein